MDSRDKNIILSVAWKGAFEVAAAQIKVGMKQDDGNVEKMATEFFTKMCAMAEPKVEVKPAAPVYTQPIKHKAPEVPTINIDEEIDRSFGNVIQQQKDNSLDF